MECGIFKRILRGSIFLSIVIASLFCSVAYSQTIQVTVTGPTSFQMQVSNVYNWRVERKVNNTWSTFVSGGPSGLSASYTLPGGIHYFRLYNCYPMGGGCSTSSNKIIYLEGEQPPQAPNPVTATIGIGAINVGWNRPTNTLNFQIYRNGALRSTSNSLTYADTGVSPGVTYTYAVKACNAAGCSAATSKTITYPAIPAVPTLSARVDKATAVINWSVPSGATSLKLRRNTTSLPASISQTQYIDSGIAAGSSYTYYLSACNAAGVCSANATAVLNVAPLPAVPVVTTTFGGATIMVSWTVPAGTTSFKVQRNGVDLTVSGNSYHDKQLGSGTSFVYTVKACNVNQQCSAAGSALVTTPSGPLFEVVATGANSLVFRVNNIYSWSPEESANNGVTWTRLSGGGPSNFEVSFTRRGGTYRYRLYNCYPTTGGCSTSTAKTITLSGSAPAAPAISSVIGSSSITLNWNAPAGATSYNFTRNGAAVSTSGTSYTDNSAVPGVTYSYGVKACNVYGDCSAFANISAVIPRPQTKTLTYTYDALGRLTYVSDTVNGDRDFDYDAAGNRRLVETNVANDEATEPAQ